MVKKQYVVTAIAAIFLAACVVFLSAGETIDAQSCRIVRISGGAGVQVTDINIEPQSLMIPKGTCVVWFNRAKAQEVKVVFEEGKTCQNLTDAPVGFKIDAAKDCYVTDYISFGGTSSLRFVEEGTFKYTVETEAGEKGTARITVQK
jgi:hypothetical protein